MEEFYIKSNKMEVAIKSQTNVSQEFEEVKSCESNMVEMRNLLNTQSIELMEAVHSLNLQRNESGQPAALEVRLLQEEISQLETLGQVHY